MGLLVLDEKGFKILPYMNLCKTNYPRGGSVFDPRAIIWTVLVEVQKIKLQTKGLGLEVSDKKIF